MHLSLATANVLHQALSEDINMVYQPSFSTFDHLLFLANNHSMFYVLGLSPDTKYSGSNVLSLPENLVDMYNYNAYISNNILASIQNQIPNVFHINSVIMVHDDKPNNLKKEDRAIINNKLWKNTKIFFHKNHIDTWQLNNKTVLMEYGIPMDHISYSTQFNNRTKDILIVGDKNSLPHKSLQSTFLEKKYTCDIDMLHQPNLESIDQLLNTYKICVIINNAGWVDALCAAAAGCCVLTTLPMNNHNISSISLTPSIDTIIDNAVSILQNNETDHLDRVQRTRQEIATHFHFDLFKTQINNILYNIAQREVFVL